MVRDTIVLIPVKIIEAAKRRGRIFRYDLNPLMEAWGINRTWSDQPVFPIIINWDKVKLFMNSPDILLIPSIFLQTGLVYNEIIIDGHSQFTNEFVIDGHHRLLARWKSGLSDAPVIFILQDQSETELRYSVRTA